ncbi:MAG: Spy/CpxP family protein refolding chaperone [Syntrophales bacterium]
MKRTGILIIVLLVAAFLAVFSPAEGRDGPRGRFGPGSYAAPDFTEMPGLDLMPVQREVLTVLRESHLRDIRPMQNTLEERSRELRRLWLETSPDWEHIRIVQQEVRLLWDRIMEQERLYLREAIRILTQEQQAVVRDSESVSILRPGMGRDVPGGMGRGRGMTGR